MVLSKKRFHDFIPALLLATLVVVVGWQTVGVEAGSLLAICRELMAGSDQGRQALVGSCWYAPLPTLVTLPFVWLWGAGERAALIVTWFAWVCALSLCGRITTERPRAGVALMVMVSGGVLALALGAVPAVAIVAYLMIFALRSAALWYRRQGLRDLVKLGAALAGLTLCGAPLFGITVALALVIPLGALRGSATRGRLPAILLLGWLPSLYILGIWVLMNRLIFGSALFFVANLRNAHLLVWDSELWRWVPQHPAEIVAVAVAAYALLMGALTQNRRAAVLGVLGVVAWFWLALLRGFGLEWSAEVSRGATLICGAMALWHLRHACESSCPPRAALGDVGIFVFIALLTIYFTPPTLSKKTDAVAMLKDAEAYALERTPHARIFVCGYSGLPPVHAINSTHIEPNLDIYVEALRNDYFGQTIFLLVPKPQAAAAAENVHTRLPHLYEAGGGRLAFARECGDWRLFEVLGAPSERQLNEWRKTTSPIQ